MRSNFMLATTAAAFALVTLAPVAASAVPVTFATFSSLSGKHNYRFVNSGNARNRAQDAVIYTTTTQGGGSSSAAEVQFSFLQAGFQGAVTNVQAMFQLDATVAKGSPVTGTTNFVQPGITGTFSFTSESDIVVNNVDYAPGSNLLSGTFNLGTLTGVIRGSAGSTDSSTLGGSTVTFFSDFLDFSNTINRDRGLTLTSVAPVFAIGSNGALKSFRATAGGQFSSDPAPIITSLPVSAPTDAGLLSGGLALLAIGLRKRARRS